MAVLPGRPPLNPPHSKTRGGEIVLGLLCWPKCYSLIKGYKIHAPKLMKRSIKKPFMVSKYIAGMWRYRYENIHDYRKSR